MAPKRRRPSAATIEAELADTVRGIYSNGDRDQLTVNLVRQRVEAKLSLGNGFFKDDEWKAKSKDIIKDAVETIESAEPTSSQVTGPPAKDDGNDNAGASSPEPNLENTPPAKATKKRRRAQAVATKESSSELSGLGDASGDEVERPAKKTKATAQGPGRRKRVAVVESDAEDDNDGGDGSGDDANEPDKEAGGSSDSEKTPKHKAEGALKKDSSKPDVDVPPDADSDSELSEIDEDAVGEGKKEPADRADDTSSSEPEMIDEPPKRRSKKGGGVAEAKARGKPKGARSKSAGSSKAAAELGPEEAEVKKLQGQLVKCGVRKIWAFELKKYGDDGRAKIRHLKGMLKDVGMDGRFSEAKAREIKERRELLADLEAVTEMNENWGVRSGRASRSRASKPMKLPSDDEEENGGDGGGDDNNDGKGSGGGSGDDDSEDEEEMRVKAQARRSAKYRADMAFLGDESESD